MKRLLKLFAKNKPSTTAQSVSGDVPPNQLGNKPGTSTSRAVSKTSHPIGCETLYAGEEPIIADIVFVHGLRGHRTDTWTKDGICWPEQFLPKEKGLPNVRILAFGYDANIITPFGPASLNTLFKHSISLVNDLWRERKPEADRPIIFVAHSIGGLLVKDAIGYSRDYENDPRGSIFKATHGIIFLGTPHRGSNVAGFANLLAYLAKLGGRPINHNLNRSLETESDLLNRIRDKFSVIWKERRGLAVWSFVEELPLPFIGKQVVEDNSATIGDPREILNTIHADHIGMTKYSSATDSGYRKVFNAINEMVDSLKTAPSM